MNVKHASLYAQAARLGLWPFEVIDVPPAPVAPPEPPAQPSCPPRRSPLLSVVIVTLPALMVLLLAVVVFTG